MDDLNFMSEIDKGLDLTVLQNYNVNAAYVLTYLSRTSFKCVHGERDRIWKVTSLGIWAVDHHSTEVIVD
jgi:hypothetical protein